VAVLSLLSGLLILLAACGGDDNNGPSGGSQLSSSEAAALSAAIVGSGAVEGEASLVAPLAFALVKGYGTFTPTAPLRAGGLRLANLASSYNATGYQVKYDFTVNGTQQIITTTGAVAWAGLNVQAQTVEELMVLSAFSTDPTFPTSGTSEFGVDDIDATWVVRGTNSLYHATSGTATLTSASFSGGTTDCSRDVPGFGTINCTYRYGDMAGEFSFDAAAAVQGTGPATLTWNPTTYGNLPAVQVVLSANVTLPGVKAADFFKAFRAQVGAAQ
jgi:hypothetical protein